MKQKKRISRKQQETMPQPVNDLVLQLREAVEAYDAQWQAYTSVCRGWWREMLREYRENHPGEEDPLLRLSKR